MPLYEYKCKECGPFELWRTLAELSEELLCRQCHGSVQRIFSPPMILSSGFSSVRKQGSPDPRLVKSSQMEEPAKPKFQPSSGSRPWMIQH